MHLLQLQNCWIKQFVFWCFFGNPRNCFKTIINASIRVRFFETKSIPSFQTLQKPFICHLAVWFLYLRNLTSCIFTLILIHTTLKFSWTLLIHHDKHQILILLDGTNVFCSLHDCMNIYILWSIMTYLPKEKTFKTLCLIIVCGPRWAPFLSLSQAHLGGSNTTWHYYPNFALFEGAAALLFVIST